LNAQQWNELVPPTTPVRYWPVRNRERPWFDGQEHVDTRTRSEAWHTGDGRAIVKVEGIAGGVSVLHLAVNAAKVLRDTTEVLKNSMPRRVVGMFKASGESLPICYGCGQEVQSLPTPPVALEPAPASLERHSDCTCSPGGVCWSCLACGDVGS
jgi:hypothetical protein